MLGGLIGKLLGSAVVGGLASLLGGGTFRHGALGSAASQLASGIFGGENSPFSGLFNKASDPQEQAIMTPGVTGAVDSSPNPTPRPTGGGGSPANPPSVAVQPPASGLLSGVFGGGGGGIGSLLQFLPLLAGVFDKKDDSGGIPEGWGDPVSDERMAEHRAQADFGGQYDALSDGEKARLAYYQSEGYAPLSTYAGYEVPELNLDLNNGIGNLGTA